MKKLLIVTILLSFSVSAFAAQVTTGAMANGDYTAANGGVSVHGGQTADSARDSTGALIRLSNKVVGKVNWEAVNAATGLSTSYQLFTKHDGGSKVFGSGSANTQLFFKIVPAKTFTNADVATAVGDISANDGTTFTSVLSWSAL